MKLNTTHLRYLTSEDWRVLTAVEQGSKNHEIVPTPLIIKLSHLQSGSGAHRSISTLAKANLIARVQNAKYDGYRLTYGGLDYLALHTHFQRKTLHSTGQCIGTGKESDIHIVLAPPPPPPPPSQSITPSSSASSPHPQTTARRSPQQCILKIHRLGRISFRTIKNNRDYLRHRTSASWMHMSRLSALKEHTFMTALHAAGFPVPTPLAWNRHTVVMSLVEGTPLYQVRHLEEHEARRLYAELMDLIVRLARAGLIHGDFNEFNIMLEERESSIVQSHHPLADVGEKLEQDDERQDKITNVTLHPVLIDFPQMLSISHPNASTYFDRDVNCIKHYFSRRFHFTSDDSGPFFKDVERQMRQTKGVGRLDVEVEASGFSKKMAKELANYMNDVGVGQAGSDVDSVSDASEESESSDSRSRDTYDDHHHCETSSGHGHGFVVNRNLEASEVEEALSANQGSKHGSPKVAPTVSIESSVAESP
ncbi:Serine/threonine-protein kinase rio2 [Xanthoria calcicola]